jgi:hypothetical protein
LNSKLGLKEVPNDQRAKMFLGDAIHLKLQNHDFYEDPSIVSFEREVEEEFENDTGTTVIRGHSDAVDENGVLYDFKTTSNVEYVQDEPNAADVDQVQTYLNLTDDAEEGRLVYLSRWIDDDSMANPFQVVQHEVPLDEDRFYNDLVDKAHSAREDAEILAEIKDAYGAVPERYLPEKCDNWLCDIETLDDEAVF